MVKGDDLKTITATLQLIKDQQSVMNEKLDSHSASLVNIESKYLFLKEY